MKKGFNKRALSDIVSTLLILLLVFVAVAILWLVVRNVIKQGTEQISLGKFTLDLKIEKVTINSGSIDVKVKRNVGAGEFTGLSFILDDGENTEIVEFKNLSMTEYAERTFNLIPPTLNPNNIKSIELAPIFTLSSGKEVVGDVKDVFEIVINTGGTPYVNNCGNGIINSGESCDGTNISATATCASVLGSSSATGTLSCSATCIYVTTGCSIPTCGDGDIDTGEECDSDSILDGGTCASVLGVVATGTLGCEESSCQYDTTGCTVSCTDTCSSLGYTCGTWTICGTATNCGTCSSGTCNSTGQCAVTCTDTCSSLGYQCGTQTVCGVSTNCGTCSSGTCNSTGQCAVSTPSWQSGMVSWWTLDTDASDSFGNNDGTSTTGAVHLTSGCHDTGCYNFPTSDGSRIALPDVADLQMRGKSFTIAAWVYPTAYVYPGKSNGGIIGGEVGAAAFTLESDGSLIMSSVSVTSAPDSTLVVPLNTWSFVAITFSNASSSNNLIYYLNENSQTYSWSVSFSSGASTNVIGQRTANDGTIPGRVDEVMVWNRALSASEISQAMASA